MADATREDERSAPKRRSWRSWLGAGLSVAIFGGAIFILMRTFMTLNVTRLQEAMQATSAAQIARAAGFTALSYFALTGYDAVALRQLRARVPYRTTALASFTSYAVSFTLGFPLITAGTVRYWIYSRAGLTASKVASLTVVASVTFWLGMALIIGAGLTLRADAISELNHVQPSLNVAMGLGVFAALLAYFVWVSLKPRQTRIQGLKLELPGLRLTLGQMALGMVDLCAASAVVFSLLPEGRGTDFVTFAATYVFACLIGIVSNAPGGVGVFEVTMMQAFPGYSREALLASLLLFRIVYYLMPFILALLLLGATDAAHRWKTRAGAAMHQDPG